MSHGRHRLFPRVPLLLCVLCSGLFCDSLKASGISAHDADLFRNTGPVLIFRHDYTSYMLSPEWAKGQEEKEKVIKEEFRKAAEAKRDLEIKDKEKEGRNEKAAENREKRKSIVVLPSVHISSDSVPTIKRPTVKK